MDFLFKTSVVFFLVGAASQLCFALRCYTCTVDFRYEPFTLNNTCLFPKDHDDLAHCSGNSKFCKGVVTRVGGVFVMLQRSCAKTCLAACTEKGFGIRIKDCTSCCTKEPDCGTSDLVKKKKK